MPEVWIRQCQECNHRQKARPPAEYKSEAWRETKCRNCGSAALSFGSSVSVDAQGKEIPDDGSWAGPVKCEGCGARDLEYHFEEPESEHKTGWTCIICGHEHPETPR